MKQYFTIEKAPIFIKLFIAFALYMSVKDLSSIHSFATLAVALLEFIIILELVRMVIDFVFSDDNRIRLRLMVDSTIVFFIRDIMLIVSDKFDIEKIAKILAIIAALFLFRVITMKYSPSIMELKYRNKTNDKE